MGAGSSSAEPLRSVGRTQEVSQGHPRPLHPPHPASTHTTKVRACAEVLERGETRGYSGHSRGTQGTRGVLRAIEGVLAGYAEYSHTKGAHQRLPQVLERGETAVRDEAGALQCASP